MVVVCAECKKDTSELWCIKNKWGVYVHVCTECFDKHMEEMEGGEVLNACD